VPQHPRFTALAMDITQWYAMALGSLVVLFHVSHPLLLMMRISGTYIASSFLKHLYHPRVRLHIRGSNRYIGFSSKTTRFDVLLVVLFLVGNAVCLSIEVKDVTNLTKRSGLLCIINLVPLALGEHMNLVASFCGVRLRAYASMHEWLGRVVMAEGLIHSVAAISSQHLNLQSTFAIAELMVSYLLLLNSVRLTGLNAVAAGVLLLLSSLAWVRRRFYEVFQKLHLILAATLMAAIYLHSASKNIFRVPICYLFATICLQISIGALRIGRTIYRNIKHRTPLSLATIRTITYKRKSGNKTREIPVLDAVHVHIRLARPWTWRAGQWVYLSIPGVSRTSFVQSHPFFVSWWYRDSKGDNNIVLIIEKRKGFTKDLVSVDPHSEMRAIVEGPYGRELHLELYGTVLLFATGIGIAGQLPYVTQLLEGYHNYEVKGRRIALFWEMDSERKRTH
jgi:predicted ferric reductase